MRDELAERPLRLLLAEDDDDHVKLLERALRRMATQVELVVARDGAEALELIRQCEPDGVFVDINLPRLTGLEVCREIRETLGMLDVPIVMLTTSARQEDRDAAVPRWAEHYVVKPVNFRRFTESVEAILPVFSALRVCRGLPLSERPAQLRAMMNDSHQPVCVRNAARAILARLPESMKRPSAGATNDRRHPLRPAAGDGDSAVTSPPPEPSVVASRPPKGPAATSPAPERSASQRPERSVEASPPDAADVPRLAGSTSDAVSVPTASPDARLLAELDSADEARSAVAIIQLARRAAMPGAPFVETDAQCVFWAAVRHATAGLPAAKAADRWRGFAPVALALTTSAVDQAGRLRTLARDDSTALPVRATAVAALGRLGDRAALPDLRALLETGPPELGAQAAEAIGRIGDEAATPALAVGARSPHAGLRMAALRALAQQGSLAAVHALAALLGDPEPAVRLDAAIALGTTSGPAHADLLLGALDREVEAGIVHALVSALGRVAREASERMRALTSHPNAHVREAARFWSEVYQDSTSAR